MRAMETRFADELAAHFDKYVEKYNALPESRGGRVLNTDIARELSSDYAKNRNMSGAVHEPASWFIQRLYAQRLLEAPAGKVLFTAGGTGAGKSAALRGQDLTQWPIVYDTNMARAESGAKKVNQALAAGRDVDMYYVYSDPLEAFRRAITRSQDMAKRLGSGRTVPVSAHVNSHLGSREAIPQLMVAYANDPRVNFRVTLTKRGVGARDVGIADLPSLSDTQVREVIDRELEEQRQQGKISEAEFQAFRAEGVTESESAQQAGRQVGPGEETVQASLNQPARGQIRLGQDMKAQPSVITLLEHADLSTFLHESGHFFFEVLTDIASRPGSPPELAADVQKLFDFTGFKGTAAEWRASKISDRRDAHEKFARAFEAYLMEGKAPNPEVRTLFHRFRSWMLNIYKSLSKLNVPISDEVRGVMDRMIATRDQIAAVEQVRNMAPLFKDAAAAGMSEADWTQYQQMASDATENAQDQLQTRSLRNLRWLSNARARELVKLQKENEAKRQGVRAEVAAAVAQRPERVAETLLTTGEAWVKGEDGQPKQIKLDGPLKLSTAALAAKYGSTEDYRNVAADAGSVDPKAIRAPWHDLPKNLVAKEGIDPDELAELVGMSSGDELVKTLIAMPERNKLIDAVTDERVLRKYGDLADQDELQRAVDIALHNQMRTRMVATELAVLEKSQAIGTRRDKLRQAAREFADRVIRGKKVRDLRPGQFAAGETRAALLAAEAMRKGDFKEAAARKRDQLFNGYANRAAARAQETVEKQLRYLAKFNETGTRKNLDPSYRDQIDKLLERYSFKVSSLKDIDKRTSLRAWIKEQEAQGNDPVIPDELVDEANRTHYRNLTVEQFSGLVDAVKNIEHLARLKHTLLVNKRQRDFAIARDELTTSIAANESRVKADELERDESLLGRAGDLLTSFFTSLRKLSSVARIMDGIKDGGMAWEYLVRPLNDAADHELHMRKEATQKLNALFDKVPGLNPGFATRQKRKIVGLNKTFIPAINKSMSLEARIAVALNWGNEGNRQRIMEGNKWTEQQAQAVIDTLTKDQMDFVQGTLDFIGSYWGAIKAKQERVTGVAPEAVDASPIRTRHGEYKGGYYPIVADPMRSDKAAQQNDAELIAQSLRGSVTRATTRRGHTEARVGGKDPVRLDLNVIPQHIAQVTHDLAWHETLIDYNHMIRDSAVSGTIRERYGPNTTAMLRQVTDAVARGDVGPRTAMERVVAHLRTGSTVATLGFSVTTSLMQLAGVPQSFVRAGYGTVAHGYARYAANPVAATRMVYEKSKFMRIATPRATASWARS